MRAQVLAKALILLSLFAATPALAAETKTGQLAANQVFKHKCPFAPDYTSVSRSSYTHPQKAPKTKATAAQ